MKQKKSGSVIKNNYWSPYTEGFLIGLVLLLTFYLSGATTLQKWFGTSQKILFIILALIAFISFWVAEKFEKR